MFLFFGMAPVLSDSTGPATARPVLKAAKQDGSASQTYIYSGLPGGKSVFSGFPSGTNVAALKKIEIRDAIISAGNLTTSLDGSSSLSSIHMDASGMIGHCKRAYLPSLTTFEFNWLPKVNADEFKNATILKEILFFDKVPNQKWDFHRDVLNLPVNISLMVDGTMILVVNRATGAITLNVHFCSDVLKYAEGDYTRLSLAWCPLTDVSMVSPELTYISLNNALPPPGELPKLLRRLTKLEEFHAFQPLLGYDDQAPLFYYTPDDPYFQTPIDLNDFAPSLKKLSVGRLALVATEDYVSNVVDLTLENSNISSVVIGNFVSMFPSLMTIRLFNISGLLGQDADIRLLSNVFKTKVTKIVVTGFQWGRESDPVGKEVTEYLKTRGLNGDESDFLVLRESSKGGELVTEAVARSMTFLERNYKRFESMGFKDIDTYEDYLLYDSVNAVSASGASQAVHCYFFVFVFTAFVAIFTGFY